MTLSNLAVQLIVGAVMFGLGYAYGRRTETDPPRGPGPWRRADGWLTGHAGAVLVVLALVSAGLWTIQTHRVSERAACQTTYNRAVAVQVRERARINSASDQAQSDLLRGVARLFGGPPTTDPKVQAERGRRFLALLHAFESAADAAEVARRDTPLPPIPEC